MPISRSQLYELMLPFVPNEHGFTPIGGSQVPYIKKSAIERRLFRVVPSWSMTEVLHLASENDMIALTGALILEGQAFTAVGAAIILKYKKEKDGGYAPLPAPDVARNTAKAYKQADSDLLPRCAKLAGVGWYLREIPPDWKAQVSSPQGLSAYLTFVRDGMKGWNPDSSSEPRMGSISAVGGDDARRIR